ncbi:MAG: phenylalanine--tRNA ligase subunit beta [Nonlabens sp.]
MHELGQPLHAFDLKAISGNKIIVKTLPKNTLFTTLDGIEHQLHEDDLMICDTEKPLCIAGVYGGLNSGVTEATTSIFLESAYFNPVSVRKTAKRHNFNTDASFRFERGIDPNITEYALKRAALLIQETGGGDISSDISDLYSQKIEDEQVFLPFAKVNSLIGQEIPKEEIKSILRTLDINVNNVTESGLGLTIPAYRNDVTRPVDVIEEILRVYGYDRIESASKLNATIAKSSKLENNRLQNIVAQQLVGQGFLEMMANSLTSEKNHMITEQISPKNEVRMLNPLSSDLAVMRQSLIYGGLEAIAHNLNRKQENLRLFEFGSSYHQYQERQFTENKHLSIITTGNTSDQTWNSATQPADFFYLKGAVIAVLKRLGIHTVNEQPTKLDFLSEGIALSSGVKIADLGVVKKKVAKSFGVEVTVHFANIYWSEILKIVSKEHAPVKETPKFPEVSRDFALLVDDAISFKQLREIALNSEKKILKSVQLFDVYEGGKLPKGKKSYALNFTLQDTNKTLTDKQIDKTMNKIQQQLENQAGAVLR